MMKHKRENEREREREKMEKDIRRQREEEWEIKRGGLLGGITPRNGDAPRQITRYPDKTKTGGSANH